MVSPVELPQDVPALAADAATACSVDSTTNDVLVEKEKETAVLLQAIERLTARAQHADEERRRCLASSRSLRGSVRIMARVRPQLPHDPEEEEDVPCLRVHSRTQLEVMVEPRALLTEQARPRRRTVCTPLGRDSAVGSRSTSTLPDAHRPLGADGPPEASGRGFESRAFYFDQIFAEDVSDDDVFNSLLDELSAAVDGEAVCILAYGATGSGKTHTVSNLAERAALELERQAILLEKGGLRLEMTVQIVEIYNETLRDLLIQESAPGAFDEPARPKLSVSNSCATLQGAAQRAISSDSPAGIARSLDATLQMGQANRSTFATGVHGRSSRSHLVMTLMLTTRDSVTGAFIKTGKFSLVDLAGSERIKRSEAVGDRLKEAQYINRSLSALADVIYAKERRSGHVPYRNSKLTHLLQDSLGGQTLCRTVVVVALPPTRSAMNETLHSLQFSTRLNSLSSQISSRRSLHEAGRVRDDAMVEADRLRLENTVIRAQLDEQAVALEEREKELEDRDQQLKVQKEMVLQLTQRRAASEPPLSSLSTFWQAQLTPGSHGSTFWEEFAECSPERPRAAGGSCTLPRETLAGDLSLPDAEPFSPQHSQPFSPQLSLREPLTGSFTVPHDSSFTVPDDMRQHRGGCSHNDPCEENDASSACGGIIEEVVDIGCTVPDDDAAVSSDARCDIPTPARADVWRAGSQEPPASPTCSTPKALVGARTADVGRRAGVSSAGPPAAHGRGGAWPPRRSVDSDGSMPSSSASEALASSGLTGSWKRTPAPQVPPALSRAEGQASSGDSPQQAPSPSLNGSSRGSSWQGSFREPANFDTNSGDSNELQHMLNKLQRRKMNGGDPEGSPNAFRRSPDSPLDRQVSKGSSGGSDCGIRSRYRDGRLTTASSSSQSAVASAAEAEALERRKLRKTQGMRGVSQDECVLRLPGGPAHAHRGSPPPPAASASGHHGHRGQQHSASSSKSGACSTPQSFTPSTPPVGSCPRTGSRDRQGNITGLGAAARGARDGLSHRQGFHPSTPTGVAGRQTRRTDRSSAGSASTSPRSGTGAFGDQRHSDSSSSSRCGRKATPREYIVEVISPQRARELTRGNLPPPQDLPGQAPNVQLLSSPQEGCYENISSNMARSTSSISVSSDEGDIKIRLREALRLEQSFNPLSSMTSTMTSTMTSNGEGLPCMGSCRISTEETSTEQIASEQRHGTAGVRGGPVATGLASPASPRSRATASAGWAHLVSPNSPYPASVPGGSNLVVRRRTPSPPASSLMASRPDSRQAAGAWPWPDTFAAPISAGMVGFREPPAVHTAGYSNPLVNLPYQASRSPHIVSSSSTAVPPPMQMMPTVATVLGRGPSYGSPRAVNSYTTSGLAVTTGARRTAVTSPSSSCGPPQTPRRTQTPDWTRQHSQYAPVISRLSLGSR